MTYVQPFLLTDSQSGIVPLWLEYRESDAPDDVLLSSPQPDISPNQTLERYSDLEPMIIPGFGTIRLAVCKREPGQVIKKQCGSGILWTILPDRIRDKVEPHAPAA